MGRFESEHPTVQMLAFNFLLLSVFLMAEGFGKHIDRGYINFAMDFSLFVEFLTSACADAGLPDLDPSGPSCRARLAPRLLSGRF